MGHAEVVSGPVCGLAVVSCGVQQTINESIILKALTYHRHDFFEHK